MLEAALVGTDHLKDAPAIKRTIDFYKPSPDVQQNSNASSKMPGFYMPSEESDEDSEDELEYDTEGKIANNDQEETSGVVQNVEDSNLTNDALVNVLEISDLDISEPEDEVLEGDDCEGYDADDVDDDDEGWITPSNCARKKGQMALTNEKQLLQRVEVACMTSDFAMQVTY